MARKGKDGKDRPPTYQSPLERYPEYIQALGMISVELAILEWALARLLGALFRIPPSWAEAVYFASNSTIPRVNMLKRAVAAVCPSKDDEMRKDLDKFLGGCIAAMGKRHDKLHSAWLVDPATSKVAASGLPIRAPQFVNINELRDIIESLRRNATEAIQLASDVSEALYEQPPLHDRSSSQAHP
jgi:hypothetical protein